MHRVREAPSGPVAQYVRLRFPALRPIRLEGPPDPGLVAEERSLAVCAAPPSRAHGDSIARRRRNASPSTRAHRLRGPRRAPEDRRAVRQGRRTQPDADVQSARHGGRGPDGLRPGGDDSCCPDRGQRWGRVGGVCRDVRARAIVIMASDGPPHQAREATAFGAEVLRVDEDIADAGRIVSELSSATDLFSLATLREPYRIEGKKTMLLEIWEALGGMPDWILFPTGGGTGILGRWKALHELRELGWYEDTWPRFGVIQAEGCAPLVRAWKAGRETAEPWPMPQTEAAGLRVPATLADRIVLRAIRDTRGAAVAVSDAAMKVAALNLAVLEGISAGLRGAATLAGLRHLYDDGTIRPEDRVVLVNTGASDGGTVPALELPEVKTADQVGAYLGLTSRAS